MRLKIRNKSLFYCFVFKFALIHIYDYRHYTLHVYRPWSDLFNCNLSVWPWPVQGHLIFLVNLCIKVCLMFMNIDLMLCMFIDLDQISWTATFLFDPDLDFFCLFWLTFAFKFALIHINDYRHYTSHVYRPWSDLFNCNLSVWPWPWLFLFKVTQ